MPLRRRLLHPETLQTLVLAAEERYFDAAELLARGRTTGAVYLAGFVAEMLLKHAAFRLQGAGPSARVGALFGPTMKKWAKRLLPTIDPEQKHSLWFWALLVRRIRRDLGRPFVSDFDSAFVRRARRLHGNWSVDLRYSEMSAGVLDAKEAFEDMAWIKTHNSRLWR